MENIEKVFKLQELGLSNEQIMSILAMNTVENNITTNSNEATNNEPIATTDNVDNVDETDNKLSEMNDKIDRLSKKLFQDNINNSTMTESKTDTILDIMNKLLK